MPTTVQNARFPIRQLNTLYGYVLAILWYAVSIIIRLTLRVSYQGKDNLVGSTNHIFAFWHENLPIHFAVNLRIKEPQIWLQHPMLFMKPVHVMVKLMGVKELAYGSSGHGGKVALERVLAQLRNGYSTMINPDGPHGPAKVLKPGVIIMSKQTGVPIIPVTMKVSNYKVLHTWDRKIMPLPFSRIEIRYHPPVHVNGIDEHELMKQLEETLSC